MRPRKQVESSFYRNPALGSRYATSDDERYAVLMEVLLDIRDLLKPEITGQASPTSVNSMEHCDNCTVEEQLFTFCNKVACECHTRKV